MNFLLLLNLLLVLGCVSSLHVPSAREQKRTKEVLKDIPNKVENTIRGLNAQGVPKEAIMERVKHIAKEKDIPAERLVDGVLKKDPRRDSKISANEKKRAAQLKNEIREQEKKQRKAKSQRRRNSEF
jgi:hypothetical protein